MPTISRTHPVRDCLRLLVEAGGMFRVHDGRLQVQLPEATPPEIAESIRRTMKKHTQAFVRICGPDRLPDLTTLPGVN